MSHNGVMENPPYDVTKKEDNEFRGLNDQTEALTDQNEGNGTTFHAW